MQLRLSIFAISLSLCAGFAYAAPPSGMATNAEGGTFSSARTYWFSVGPKERLRLVLDGAEIYRGPGPAVAELPAAEGEEHRYDLLAERLSPAPEESLLESRSFLVVVDEAPPAPPLLSAEEDGGWIISVSAEARARVDAVVAADGVVTDVRDLSDGARFEARGLSVLAWAVDGAGNSSEPVALNCEPFELSVANPAPGPWANRQRLVVLAEGADEVRWSDDGSDPLGPKGRVYDAPVLVDKTGEVTIAVAARAGDGRVARREISYSVEAAPEAPLAALREAESAPILEERSLTIPASFRWEAAARNGSVDSIDLRYEGGRDIALRPVRSVRRAFSLLVGDVGVPRRFCFLLGGGAGDLSDPSAAGASPAESVNSGGGSVPILREAGAARVLVWQRSARIRYRLEGTIGWSDFSAPVPIPASATKVEWIVEADPSSEGPFSLSIPAVEGFSDGEPPESSVAEGSVSASAVILSAGARRSARFSLSAPGTLRGLPLALEAGERLVLDVCDGEELPWSALSEGNGEERSWTVDRAPPTMPRIVGPADGAWIARAAEVSVSGEERIVAKAIETDPSGAVSVLHFDDTIRLDPLSSGPMTVRIEAVSVDEAGNESPIAARSFMIDATTVYVGSVRRDEEGEADGSRDRPFDTLDRAIAAARAASLKRLRVIESARLVGRATLADGMILEGGFGPEGNSSGGRSVLSISPGASLAVEGGAACSLVSLSVEGSPASASPLIAVPSGARLDATSCDFIGGDAVLEGTDATVSLTDCRVVADGSGSDRVVGLGGRGTKMTLERCRIEIRSAAAAAAALDIRGGSLSLRSVIADVRAKGSAIVLAVRSVTLQADGVDGTAIADTYASVLDARESFLSWKGGALSAMAHDAALVALDACGASFSGASFRVTADSTARGLRVNGGFPSVRDSAFFASPSARSSDVFSGTEPAAESVGGNRFEGFIRLWARRYAAEDIAAFNRRYAPRDSANVVVDIEDAE